MDYQARMRMTMEQVNFFLRAFQRPTHLDEEAALGVIRAMSEEINNRICTSLDQSAFHDRVGKALRHLRTTYTQRSWPTVAHFVKAMEQTQARSAPVDARQPLEIDSMTLAAQRMNAGERVGDTYIYGTLANELLASGAVSQETMQGYRSALFFAAKDVLGQSGAEKLEADLKARADY